MMYVILCLLLAFGSSLPAQDVFRYPVELKRFPRAEKGELLIDSTGVSYKSEDGKRSIQIAPLDIHEADVSDPRRIRIETYQNLKRKLLGRQSYTFRLRETEHGPELARFLATLVRRPVVGVPSGTSLDLDRDLRALWSIAATHECVLDTVERARRKDDSLGPPVDAVLRIHADRTRELAPHLSGVRISIYQEQPGRPARRLQRFGGREHLREQRQVLVCDDGADRPGAH